MRDRGQSNTLHRVLGLVGVTARACLFISMTWQVPIAGLMVGVLTALPAWLAGS